MKAMNKTIVRARKALVIPLEEYRGLTIFESWPGYYNVVERPDWDDIFSDLSELKDYIDFCKDEKK